MIAPSHCHVCFVHSAESFSLNLPFDSQYLAYLTLASSQNFCSLSICSFKLPHVYTASTPDLDTTAVQFTIATSHLCHLPRFIRIQ